VFSASVIYCNTITVLISDFVGKSKQAFRMLESDLR
jgi:hypothetical protein